MLSNFGNAAKKHRQQKDKKKGMNSNNKHNFSDEDEHNMYPATDVDAFALTGSNTHTAKHIPVVLCCSSSNEEHMT